MRMRRVYSRRLTFFLLSFMEQKELREINARRKKANKQAIRQIACNQQHKLLAGTDSKRIAGA